jgi:hypothetical protein
MTIGLALLFGLHVWSTRAAAASELAQRGYSEVSLKMQGPFRWGFRGRKGTAECGGTFERILFSSSMTESCFDVSPTAR